MVKMNESLFPSKRYDMGVFLPGYIFLKGCNEVSASLLGSQPTS